MTYPDIYNYLINTPSFCTREKLKAYKSMDGYNFFCSGWVSNLTVIGNQIARPKIFIFMALVKHLQRLSAPPLKVYAATRHNGTGVVCPLHMYMEGIGEIPKYLYHNRSNSQFCQVWHRKRV